MVVENNRIDTYIRQTNDYIKRIQDQCTDPDYDVEAAIGGLKKARDLVEEQAFQTKRQMKKHVRPKSRNSRNQDGSDSEDQDDAGSFGGHYPRASEKQRPAPSSVPTKTIKKDREPARTRN